MLTSVAMTHSFFSSATTKTDWYESLEEHIVDILHSGLSLESTNQTILDSNSIKTQWNQFHLFLCSYLYILLKCLSSSIIFSQFSSLSKRDSSSLYLMEDL